MIPGHNDRGIIARRGTSDGARLPTLFLRLPFLCFSHLSPEQVSASSAEKPSCAAFQDPNPVLVGSEAAMRKDQEDPKTSFPPSSPR